MDILIHADGHAAPAGMSDLRQHIERRLRFALTRLRGQVQAVRVRLRNANGPRGGLDKQVQVHLRLSRSAAAVLHERGSEWLSLIDRAADRAAQAVSRRADRARRAVRRQPRVVERDPIAAEPLTTRRLRDRFSRPSPHGSSD
jgi:putative sigma-54 modulation protein